MLTMKGGEHVDLLTNNARIPEIRCHVRLPPARTSFIAVSPAQDYWGEEKPIT